MPPSKPIRATFRAREETKPWENQPDSSNTTARSLLTSRHASVSKTGTSSTSTCPRKNSKSKARAAWIAAFHFATPGKCSPAWPVAARSTTSSPSGTTSSTAASGAKRSTACTRRTTSPSSPAASVLLPARVPARSASSSHPWRLKPSKPPSSTRALKKAGSCPSRPRFARTAKSPSSAPVPPVSPAPPNSTRPAIMSPSSSAPTASAACSNTASRT